MSLGCPRAAQAHLRVAPQPTAVGQERVQGARRSRSTSGEAGGALHTSKGPYSKLTRSP